MHDAACVLLRVRCCVRADAGDAAINRIRVLFHRGRPALEWYTEGQRILAFQRETWSI